MRKPISSTLRICALALFSALAYGADPPLQFLDAHAHMSTNRDVDEQIAAIRKTGVPATVLMSFYPDQLLDAAKRNPGFVIPFVSFERTVGAPGVHLDSEAAGQLAKLLDSGAICGIGELGINPAVPGARGPLSSEQLARNASAILSADALKIYEVAAARHVPFNMHLQLEVPAVLAAITQVPGKYPRMPLILAHAGWNAGPEIIEKLLHDNANVFVDLSIRMDPPAGFRNAAAPNNDATRSILTAENAFQPAWRRLIERYPDRFLYASDINSATSGRITHLAELMEVARAALAPLSRSTQEAVAHGNLEKLVNGCPAWRPH